MSQQGYIGLAHVKRQRPLKARGGFQLAAALCMVLAACVPAAMGQSTKPEPPSVVNVEIPSACSDECNIEIDGRRMTVTVKNLDALLTEAETKGPIVLYLDGTAMAGVEGVVADKGKGVLQFYFGITSDSRAAWTSLLRRTSGFAATVSLSVGPLKAQPASSAQVITIQRIPIRPFILTVLLLATFLVAFLALARRSNLLRDLGADPTRGERAYSLARTQMAIWTFVIAGSFLFIWMTTGSLESVTGTAAVLMGISMVTVLGSAALDTSNQQLERNDAQKKQLAPLMAEQELITVRKKYLPDLIRTEPDTTKKAALEQELKDLEDRLVVLSAQINAPAAAPAPAAPSTDGFLMDILSDAAGVSLHRFQMLMWTVILAVIFVIQVARDLAMPQFNEMLLSLTGISAGAYLGFKIPENKKNAAGPKPTS